MTEHTQSASNPSAKPNRRRWAGAAVVLALVAGGGFALSGAFDAPQAQDMPTPVTAEPSIMQLHTSEVYDVAPQDLSAAIAFTGSVRPVQSADISAQVAGIANQVHVQAGDAVAAGDVLVEIDATDLNLQLRQQQSALSSTEIQLNAARQTLDRVRSLAERGSTPQANLDAAIAEVDGLEASLASLQSQVEQVQTNIGRTIIRAPFDGMVSNRMVEPGQVVSQGAVVVSLVDLSRVTVDAMVPLAQTASITAGQTASLEVQGLDGSVFEAAVERINPVAEEGTRSVVVHLGLDNPDSRLRGGMFVTGRIVTEAASDVIAVPQDAVLGDDEEHYVLAVVDGEITRRAVSIEKVWDRLGMVEIGEGVASGDLIVALPLSGLEAGQSVVVGAL
ncbi:efflux RND transporter periplasmic adaptor subunit [Pelagibacterium halotolerans]|nr:efflux RND transporter periplasmic adaptor subunit [Pelagibacterium halotolerans]QJR17282.1 efflux RND transporter periplasmic adaptor subunit [Pelagibacterium halotolerans]